MRYLLLSVLVVCVIGVMIPSAFGESEIYHEFKERWNWYGSTSQSGAEGAFDSPRSIAIDSKDFVYVVDSKHRIQKFSSEGELVSVWKNIGRSALEINSKDEVYVVDGTANAGYKVVKLSDDGQIIETWCTNKSMQANPDAWAKATGTSDQGFPSIGCDHKLDLLGKSNPAIFVDKSDNIYFSERKYISSSPTIYEIKVLKYSPNGQLLKTFENMGMPSAQDDDGNLYATSSGIVDWSNSECHIIKYNSLGEYIDRFGDCGTRSWLDIEIDSNGVIYATSGVRGSIYKFSTDGEALGRIGSCCGIQEQHYANPTGIALDSQNNVFVIDYSRHSVFVYTPVEQKLEQSSNNIDVSNSESKSESVQSTESKSESVQSTESKPESRDTMIENGIEYERYCDLHDMQYNAYKQPGYQCQGWKETDRSYEKRVMTPLYTNVIIIVMTIGAAISIITVIAKSRKKKKLESVKRKPAKKKETSEFCIQCGAELKPTAKFCAKCGNQV